MLAERTDATSCCIGIRLFCTLLDCAWSGFVFLALAFKIWQRVAARMQAMQLVGLWIMTNTGKLESAPICQQVC